MNCCDCSCGCNCSCCFSTRYCCGNMFLNVTQKLFNALKGFVFKFSVVIFIKSKIRSFCIGKNDADVPINCSHCLYSSSNTAPFLIGCVAANTSNACSMICFSCFTFCCALAFSITFFRYSF